MLRFLRFCHFAFINNLQPFPPIEQSSKWLMWYQCWEKLCLYMHKLPWKLKAKWALRRNSLTIELLTYMKSIILFELLWSVVLLFWIMTSSHLTSIIFTNLQNQILRKDSYLFIIQNQLDVRIKIKWCRSKTTFFILWFIFSFSQLFFISTSKDKWSRWNLYWFSLVLCLNNVRGNDLKKRVNIFWCTSFGA